MNQLKKLLALVLCLAMVLSVLPMSVLAAEASAPRPDEPASVIGSGSCGDNLSWTLTDAGVLTITGTGNMTEWSSTSAVPWYSNRSSIKTVSIGSGVTSIGQNAFRGCGNLENVSIPNTVTAIGSSVFADCYALTEITIPGSVQTVGTALFVRCHALTSVTIEEGVPLISYNMFAVCDGLESLTLPNSITRINQQAFQYCRALRSIKIPCRVTSIGNNAFDSCDVLTNIDFYGLAPTIASTAFNGLTAAATYPAGSWSTDALQQYGGTITWSPAEASGNCGDNLYWRLDTDTGALYIFGSGAMYDYTGNDGSWAPWYDYRTTIKSITICDGASSVGNYAFYNCTKALSIDFGSTVTTIGSYAFKSGYELRSITIPDSVSSIGSYAFNYCNKASSVSIGKNVASIGTHAFTFCEKVTAFTVDPDNTAYTSQDGVLFNKAMTNLMWYPSGNTRTSYTIPYSVTSLGLNSFGFARNLTSIDLNQVRTISGGAFYACSGLTELTIPDTVTGLPSQAFAYCTGLQRVTLGKGLTSLGANCFQNCTALTEMTFTGPAPTINSSAFTGVTATAYYPSCQSGWTSDKLQDYGGTITWIAYVRQYDLVVCGIQVTEQNQDDVLGDGKVSYDPEYQELTLNDRPLTDGSWSIGDGYAIASEIDGLTIKDSSGTLRLNAANPQAKLAKGIEGNSYFLVDCAVQSENAVAMICGDSFTIRGDVQECNLEATGSLNVWGSVTRTRDDGRLGDSIVKGREIMIDGDLHIEAAVEECVQGDLSSEDEYGSVTIKGDLYLRATEESGGYGWGILTFGNITVEGNVDAECAAAVLYTLQGDVELKGDFRAVTGEGPEPAGKYLFPFANGTPIIAVHGSVNLVGDVDIDTEACVGVFAGADLWPCGRHIDVEATEAAFLAVRTLCGPPSAVLDLPVDGLVRTCAINGSSYRTFTESDGTTVAPHVILHDAAYPLWVGGVQVIEANQDDILGDGTASYSPVTNILTFNGNGPSGVYEWEETEWGNTWHNSAVIYVGKRMGELTINAPNGLSLVNSDSTNRGYGVYAENESLRIYGNLTVDASYEAICMSDGDLTVRGDLDLYGADGALNIYGDCQFWGDLYAGALDGTAVYVRDDLNVRGNAEIECTERRGVYIGAGKMTVAGDLECYAPWGIEVQNGDFRVDGDLTVVAQYDMISAAILAFGKVTVGGGDWDVTGAELAIAAAGGIELSAGSTITVPAGGVLTTVSMGFPDGKFTREMTVIAEPDGTPAAHAVITGPVCYGLRVDGTEVTDANMNDVLDNGVFTFEPATNTLTIHDNYYGKDDFTAIIDNYGCNGLVITTEGDVELASMNTTLSLSKDTTFTGGPLKVAAGEAYRLKQAVVVTDGAAVTLQDADLSLASLYDSSILKHVGDPNNLRDGFCVVEGGNWLISNSSLHVSSADANGYNSRWPAILADHIALQNCYFVDPDSPYNYAIDYRISDDGTRVLDAEGHNVTRLDILPGDPPEVLPSYGIYVDNQEVNGHNLTDVLGNGIFSFDGDHILSVAGNYKAHKYWYAPYDDYLADYLINIYYTMIENADCEGLVIDLVQPSVFSNDLEYNYNSTGFPDTLAPGLKLSADTEITGAGLTMNWYAWQFDNDGPMKGPERSTVEVDAGVQLTIRDTAFTDVSDPNKVVYSLQGAEGSKLVVDHSAVTLSCGVSGFTGGISLVNCEIVEPEGGRISDDGASIVNADGSAASHVVIEPIPLPDGYYMIGPDGWTVDDIDENNVFAGNPALEGEYMLQTTLTAGDPIKVVKVENGAITAWYPEGLDNEYVVDAAHAGEKTVYFRPAGNSEWNAFGGYIWIEANAPVEPIETTNLHIYGSITVGSDMVVTLTVRKTDVQNYEKFWIEVVKHAADGDEAYLYGTEQDEALTEGPASWKTEFRHIFAKEMGVEIEARLCAEDANGQVYMSPALTTNIRDYLGGRLTATNNKVEQRVLAADMLNYGAAAQLYMDYDTEHLVNEELTAEQLAKLDEYETKTLPDVAKINSNYRPEGQSNILFNSVSLDNEVILTLAVRADADAEVKVLVKDHETGTVLHTLDTAYAGSHKAEFKGLGADQMREMYDFVAQVNGVETGNVRTWSVEGYVGEIRAGSNQLKTDMANALLTYGDSAAAYFAAQ